MEHAAVNSLPDDPQALKAIILTLSRQRDDATQQCDQWKSRHDDAARQRDDVTHHRDEWKQRHDAAEQKIEELKLAAEQLQLEKLRLEVELLRLKKWYYGPRADKLQSSGDVAQMLLEFATQLEARPVETADLPSDADAGQIDPRTVRRVKRRGRRNLGADEFDHLPVTRKEHDLADEDKPCPCCGNIRDHIGQETSWQIEYIPGHFERIEHVRHKYACKRCEHNAQSPQIVLASYSSGTVVIDKGMAAPGLLAYLVTSKYADYLPLYRLEAIFERSGFEISRATQGVWCGDVADLIQPLHELMIQRVLSSHVICTDDTVMPMLAPNKTKPARMWVYIGDEHNPYNIFHFTLSRGRDGPATFLKNYKKTLLADAYGGYDGVVVGNDITRAGCWAHARRKFVDAEKTHPAIAKEAVELIGALYATESQARDKPDEQRLQLRQSQSQPILARFRDRLLTWKDQLMPRHPMAQAIGYTLNQWSELSVFATDPAVPLDNNISEREMKRVVLNRKNSLFVGNQRGGSTAAMLSSLTSTCRRHEINPQIYLTQLLTNLPSTPMSRLSDWLPDRWKLRISAKPN